MPALFVMPKAFGLTSAGAAAPGSKLTFTATGTSTPQNTYTDLALTTPSANPLIADSAGFFAATYLDPSLPAYRVKLSTSADVQIWQLDDIPSNQNTSQQFRLKAVAPSLTFEETDASANNKIWRLKANSEQLLLTILNDAEGVETTVFTFDRTGTTVDSFNFNGDYLQVNGLPVATLNSGTVNIALTGMTGAVSGTLSWRLIGPMYVFRTNTAITGTSNTTALTMTGLSGFLTVGQTRILPTIVVDNGANSLAHASLTGSGTLTFGLGVAGGNFTASGTKGIPAGWQFIIA